MKRTIKLKNALFLPLTAILTMLLFTGCAEDRTKNEAKDKDEAKKEAKVINDDFEDKGGKPWAFDIEKATVQNKHYRHAVWTGEYMQMVLMSLDAGDVIELEVHEDHDQFIRVEKGKARIFMGETEDDLAFDKEVSDDWAVMIPAGYWHKIENSGDGELKIYTIYSPAEHPAGIIYESHDDVADYHHDH